MFYNSEEIFVDKFLACLRNLNILTIPFDTDAFYNGIEKMRQYFQINRNNIGEVSNEISLLFIRNPYEGNFARFRDAVSDQNGWYISFENPEYIRGIIKITSEDADSILADTDLDIEQNVMYDFAKAFCAGANIELS